MLNVRNGIARFVKILGASATILLLWQTNGAVQAATYYVGSGGATSLSSDPASPGSLGFALAGTGGAAGAAQAGDTVILENGTYDGAPNGFTVYNPQVTFQAQNWHGAIVKNSSGSNLWGPSEASKVVKDVCRGMVFGPSTGLGWSGGGGDGWQFLDCEFVSNGGVGAGSNALFEHDLFTEAYSNSFDFGGTGLTVKNCIARRGNRASADDDGVGNKEDFGTNMVFDGLIAYDNNGEALWFDTSNDGWVVQNCTFFANHGGNNWYYCNVGSGISPTQFLGFGQDGQGLSVGQHVRELNGTAADIGKDATITAVSGSNPQTITVSPALAATPAANDEFIVQQEDTSAGDGFTTEANDNGVFSNNYAYCNTGFGFYDHASGGSKFGGSGGMTVTDNLFAYNKQGFDYWPDGRDDGPAVVKYNRFKFLPGASSAIGSGGGSLGRYPGGMHVAIDYNIYDPDTNKGKWGAWYASNDAIVAGGLTDGSQPPGQDYLQDPVTWNQDQHSCVANVEFRSAPIKTYFWPSSKDTKWSDVFFPNNTFGLTDSIHQVDDSDGAVNNTIDSALAGHHAGDVVPMPVVAHTPVSNGVCEVYDLNGRWVKLNVNLADQAAFLEQVPPYVTCVPGNKTRSYTIRVVLTSVGPYDVSGSYTRPQGSAPNTPSLLSVTAGTTEATLAWTPESGAAGYSIYRSSTAGSETGTSVASAVTASSYTDTGLETGSTYYYKIAAYNSYGTSPVSNEISGATNSVAGSLKGSEIDASTKVHDLTSLGTLDWRQWGDLGGTNNKATGGGQISDLTQFGSGTFGRWSGGDARRMSFTDSGSGIPTSNDQGFDWCNTGTNTGWTFTVPADTTSRTLGLIWGGASGASVALTAHLSDGSSPDYTVAHPLTGPESSTFEETITYRAASPGQTLTITLTKTDSTPGPSLDLIAAWLR